MIRKIQIFSKFLVPQLSLSKVFPPTLVQNQHRWFAKKVSLIEESPLSIQQGQNKVERNTSEDQNKISKPRSPRSSKLKSESNMV